MCIKNKGGIIFMIIKLYDEYKSSLNSVNMARDLFKQIITQVN